MRSSISGEIAVTHLINPTATYALVSVHGTKARYPAQFMAANLSADMQNIDRIVVLIEEVRRMELPLSHSVSMTATIALRSRTELWYTA